MKVNVIFESDKSIIIDANKVNFDVDTKTLTAWGNDPTSLGSRQLVEVAKLQKVSGYHIMAMRIKDEDCGYPKGIISLGGSEARGK